MNEFAAEPIRIVYFGTPNYAVPALQALISDQRVEIALVVTQPDRPAGRGRRLTPPLVKSIAVDNGLKVFQPESVGSSADRAQIADARADLFVVAAFGRIFGPKLLALPRLGSVNLHASLLPDYRGASPISAAILEGQFRTGVSLMRMDTGLDTGPILAQRSIDILPHDTTSTLTPRLAEIGADLLIETLDELTFRRIVERPQDDAVATLTRPMVKADGWIDWSQPAKKIERQVRAMWDWPRAWTTLRGEPVQIHEAGVTLVDLDVVPGTVVAVKGGAAVATGNGQLLIQSAQNPGSKPLPGPVWLKQSSAEGERLGLLGAPEPPDLPLIRSVAG